MLLGCLPPSGVHGGHGRVRPHTAPGVCRARSPLARNSRFPAPAFIISPSHSPPHARIPHPWCQPGLEPPPSPGLVALFMVRRGVFRGRRRRSGMRSAGGPHPRRRRRSRDSQTHRLIAAKCWLPGGLRRRWRSRLGGALRRMLRSADRRSRNAQADRSGTSAESADPFAPAAGDHDLGIHAVGRTGPGIAASTRRNDAKAIFIFRTAGERQRTLGLESSRLAHRIQG